MFNNELEESPLSYCLTYFGFPAYFYMILLNLKPSASLEIRPTYCLSIVGLVSLRNILSDYEGLLILFHSYQFTTRRIR